MYGEVICFVTIAQSFLLGGERDMLKLGGHFGGLAAALVRRLMLFIAPWADCSAWSTSSRVKHTFWTMWLPVGFSL